MDASGSSRIRKSESFRNDLNKQIFRASPPDNELGTMKSERLNFLTFKREIILSMLSFDGKSPSGKKKKIVSIGGRDNCAFLAYIRNFLPEPMKINVVYIDTVERNHVAGITSLYRPSKMLIKVVFPAPFFPTRP